MAPRAWLVGLSRVHEARLVRRGYRTFSVEVEVEPVEVPNTERDERFSSVNLGVSGYLGPLGFGLGG